MDPVGYTHLGAALFLISLTDRLQVLRSNGCRRLEKDDQEFDSRDNDGFLPVHMRKLQRKVMGLY